MLQQTSKYQHNAFDEVIAEEPGALTPWLIQRKFNLTGLVWFTNEDKDVPTIKLSDLKGQPTLTIQTADKNIDLKAVKHSDIPSIFARDSTENTIIVRSNDGVMIITKPSLFQML